MRTAGKTDKPREQRYGYELHQGMSLLNVLEQLGLQDDTLRFSHCCDNGCCGICGVVCDGRPVLACRMAATVDMHVSSLNNIPVEADLVVDRSAYDERRKSLKLYSSRSAECTQAIKHIDSQSQDLIKHAARCIECLCCLSVCPVYEKASEHFAGPCDFVLVARHIFDPRDETDRSLETRQMNPQLCINCGLCSKVCPVDAQPSELIDLICKTL